MKDERDPTYRYDGKAQNPGRCVHPEGWAKGIRQCTRDRGYGPGNLYCERHAVEQPDAESKTGYMVDGDGKISEVRYTREASGFVWLPSGKGYRKGLRPIGFGTTEDEAKLKAHGYMARKYLRLLRGARRYEAVFIAQEEPQWTCED